MAGRIRGFETVGDMLRSLGVVGVFVVVLLAITLRQTPEQLVPVDIQPVVDAVSAAAPFDSAVVPGATPGGWTPTSARVTVPTDRPYSWYVGYNTADDQFVAVTQAYGLDPGFLEDVGADGEQVGTVRIDGQVWDQVERSDGSRRALVRTQDEGEPSQVTTVVVGTEPFAVLEQTAAALRPA